MTILGPQHPGGQLHRFAGTVLALFAVTILIGLIAQEKRWRGWSEQPGESLQPAERALRHGENQVALSIFADLANKDRGIAEYWLGNVTELGLGGSRSPAKAIDLYKKAADQNVVMASLRLGEIYLHGNLVLPGFDLAKNHTQRAAYQGSARAATLLGQIYASGLGAAADPREAYAWSQVATLEGDELAKQEPDVSLFALNPSDPPATLTTARDILQKIQHHTAPSPDPSRAT